MYLITRFFISRSEGYELHMKFRTTIGNGLVAIGQGNTHFSLQLRNGKLNLHSNLISKYEGIIIGENLNNTKWQKVYVAVNSSHLTLGVNDQLQATQPINPTGDNDTVFFNTYIGGIVRDQVRARLDSNLLFVIPFFSSLKLKKIYKNAFLVLLQFKSYVYCFESYVC